MARHTIVKIFLATALTVFVLVLLLSVHIYAVTRKKPVDPSLLVMARLDIKQPISGADASQITAWLYKQKGVDHVFVNPDSRIAVFTFHPATANADKIALLFSESLPYKAQRYKPTSAEIESGCPAGYTKPVSSIVKSIKQLF